MGVTSEQGGGKTSNAHRQGRRIQLNSEKLLSDRQQWKAIVAAVNWYPYTQMKVVEYVPSHCVKNWPDHEGC